MTSPFPQLTLEEAIRRRDRGAEAASDATSDAWRTACDAAIHRLAASGREFTAEDVRALVGDPPTHPNAMGARFLAASRSGLVEKLGYRQPSRASSHASVIAIWRGLARP